MKGRWIAAGVLAAAVSVGLSGLYAVLPNPLTALVSPVRQSVWELGKTLYWPFLLAGGWLAAGRKEPEKAWKGFLLAQLAMPFTMAGTYYALRCGLGLGALLARTGTQLWCLAMGFCRMARWEREENAWDLGLLVTLCALYGIFLILFTFARPSIPIFQVFPEKLFDK